MVDPATSSVRRAWSRLRSLDHRVIDPLLAAALVVLGVTSLLWGPSDADH